MALPKRLLDGYANFRKGRYASESERYLKLGEGLQKPTIMMIACCDSRAAPETIFDAGPGEMFVVRNVANLVPPYTPDGGHHATSAALEFAVQFLKVKRIVVMGHGMCGGCKAALTREMHGTEPGEGGFIADWIAMLDDAREEVVREHGSAGTAAERAIELAGVKVSLANLRTFPCIRQKERSGELKLTGAFFAISDGLLQVLDEDTGQFEQL